MKFFKNLFKFVLVVVILFAAYVFFRPQINDFLISKGLMTTPDLLPMPVTETFYNDNGEMMYSISIPAVYNAFIPQSELDRIRSNSNGVVQINQNSDGSVTINMPPEVRSQALDGISSACDDNILAGLIGGNIISITHNENYSVFYVVASDETSEAELLTLSGKLFAIGEVYGALEGNQDASCRVEVYSVSGVLVNTFNSNNIAGDIAGDALEDIGNSISEGFYNLARNVSED